MPENLSGSQSRVLLFMQDHYSEHGKPPTTREIVIGLSMVPGTVNASIGHLRNKGYLDGRVPLDPPVLSSDEVVKAVPISINAVAGRMPPRVNLLATKKDKVLSAALNYSFAKLGFTLSADNKTITRLSSDKRKAIAGLRTELLCHAEELATHAMADLVANAAD